MQIVVILLGKVCDFAYLYDMKKGLTDAEYIAELESKISSISEAYNTLSDKLSIVSNERDRLSRKCDNLENVILKMSDELRNLRRMMFGRKSERFIAADPTQLSLSFEGVDKLDEEREVEALKTQEKQSTSKIENRDNNKLSINNNRERRVFAEHLEHRDEILEPDTIPDGCKRIGEEVTELLEYKPGELYVRRLIRPKYALKDGEGVIIAPMPTIPLPRTNAGASLLAHLLVGKYQDHLPLHRQIAIFSREGVHLKASTVSDWVQSAAELLEPLYLKLRERVMSSNYIQMDESIIPVVDKDNPGATKKGYHWVVRSPELKSLFFHYDKGSRAKYVAVDILKDFQGAVQSDGYGAYDIYEKKRGVTLLGCWAHVRRKFEHALTEDPERAAEALKMIGELYAIERYAKEQNLPPDKIKELREKDAYPRIREFERWMEKIVTSGRLLKQSAMGKAIGYAYSLYPRLSRYVMDGRYQIDNNMAENAVRPLALGRKNYLFCRTHEAAYHAAIIYSLLGTCRLWDINPEEWLTDVFNRIGDCKKSKLEELLPHKWVKQE